MRMDQRQVMTPRMIQSMEILQLPLGALEERIDQELASNPTLEIKQRKKKEKHRDGQGGGGGDGGDGDGQRERVERTEGERALTHDAADGSAEFKRLEGIADYMENEDWGKGGYRDRSGHAGAAGSGGGGERDRKLDAMNNTAARGGNLQEHLLGQWAFVEASPAVLAAGRLVIDHLDPSGLLTVPYERIQMESRNPPHAQDLDAAVRWVQTLEPAGVGARTIVECLLVQLDHLDADEDLAHGHDFDLERSLVRDHLKDLEMNRYPLISKKTGKSIDAIKAAVRRLARLSPHPGRALGHSDAPPITPDAQVYLDPETGKYQITMSYDPAPSLYVRGMYKKMLKQRLADKKTRDFLTTNVRNAQWLIEAIEQRRSTIQRVIRMVVDAQEEFFEKGPEYLRPLPMIGVADRLGVHVATVSRAVSEKWIQTPRGLFPLRRFFSGGTTSAEGEDMSWDAVKEKLKIIINEEDKQAPLGDEEIVEKLKEQGIELARRTVAKYRKILQIPTARQRVAY